MVPLVVSRFFPGFRTDNEVDESRTNIAGYADFESYLSGQPGTGLLVGCSGAR